MQRYFVKDKKDNIFTISNSDSHHIINVMRMNLSDQVEIVYDEKLYIGEIIDLSNPVKVKVINEVIEDKTTIPKVIIAQALVKEQKMDYILQKSCELGAYKIIPISTERSIVKRTKGDDKKIVRWNKILKEASEQSKRTNIPILDSIMDIKDLINIDSSIKLVCSTKEKTKTIKSILSKTNISDTIIFVIGSEGGISPSEEEFLINNGFTPVSLGDNILRTETASSYILSIVNYQFMR